MPDGDSICVDIITLLMKATMPLLQGVGAEVGNLVVGFIGAMAGAIMGDVGSEPMGPLMGMVTGAMPREVAGAMPGAVAGAIAGAGGVGTTVNNRKVNGSFEHQTTLCLITAVGLDVECADTNSGNRIQSR
jgi:hypothetical protein